MYTRQEIFPIQIAKLTERRHINKQTSYGQKQKAGGEREREREESAELPLWMGVASPLSLTGGCRGERAVPNSGVSNGIRRCLCHHGDGAVPREVVMGWQVRDSRSCLQACTPKARVATCHPTVKPEKSKFYLWGRKLRLHGKLLSGQEEGGRNETHTHGAAAPEDTRRYTRRLSAQLSSRFFKSPPLFKIEKLRSLSASFTC